MTVFIILGVLFLSLIIVVPLLEKSKTRFSEEEVGKMSRWIIPALLILLVMQLLRVMWE